MASLLTTDFETGTPGNALVNGSSGFTSVLGTAKPTYVAGIRGSVSMRSLTGGTVDAPLAAKVLPALRSVLGVRFYVRMSTAVTFYALQLQTTSAVRANLVINSNGSLRMRSNSANLGAAASTTGLINSSTTSRVEWLLTATTQRLRVFTGANVDGTTPDYDSGDVAWTPTGTFDIVQVGIASSTANVSVTYDDFALDDTTWVGPTASTVTAVTAAGAVSWAGTATGQRTPKGTASGTVSWAGSATAAATPKASASGAVVFAGTATAKETPKASAAGAFSFTGAANANRTPKAAASGAVVWAGDAQSRTTGRAAAAGAITWAGAAVARTTRRVTAAGAVSWAGLGVVGSARAVTATGAVAWVGAAVAKATRKTTAAGTVSWAGSATGRRDCRATAAGSWLVGGSGVALRIPQAAASGAVLWNGSATGSNTLRQVVDITGHLEPRRWSANLQPRSTTATLTPRRWTGAVE